MADLIVKQNQTPFDLAIVAYGSVAGVFQLMEDNPWINLDEEPEVGRKVVAKGEPIDEEVKEYVNRKKINPANGGDITIPGSSAFSDGYDQESVS